MNDDELTAAASAVLDRAKAEKVLPRHAANALAEERVRAAQALRRFA